MTRPKLEIVTHCWSGDDVPIYHTLLQIQLSSILLNPSEMEIQTSVCCCLEEDKRTGEILEYFTPEFERRQGRILEIVNLEISMLWKRAIGRNECALKTKADVVWFTDCDHVFRKDSLDKAYSESVNSPNDFIFPKVLRKHRSHQLGDELIRTVSSGPLSVFDVSTLPETDFVGLRNRRAIGGLQIVSGRFCRKRGYINGRGGWLQPSKADTFEKCTSDKRFRQYVGESAVAVNIPGVYRLRHSRCGRDGGSVDHSRSKK